LVSTLQYIAHYDNIKHCDNIVQWDSVNFCVCAIELPSNCHLRLPFSSRVHFQRHKVTSGC